MDSLEKEFDHQLSGLAWSLWKELGVAGVDRFHENCLIQPEELILLTMIVSESDPRLRDEVLDWASRHHELVSVSRLRTLLKEMDPYVCNSFSKFVAALNSISSAKWPNAAENIHFKVKISGKSLLPSLESPSLLILRLRNLFGLGTKADAIAYFLTKNVTKFSASDLVETGYSKRNLMIALDQLTASGILCATYIRNKKNYELKKTKELQILIGKLPKVSPPWHKILQAIIQIRAIIPEIQNSSEVTRSVILRNSLIKIEPLLPALIAPILRAAPDFRQDWKAIIEIFNAFRQGNFFMQFEVFNEFDKEVAAVLNDLYQVDDCIDGIHMIESEIKSKPNQHAKIYQECYQLFLSFISDLEMQLKKFLDFPFYKIMDEPLSEICYQFSKKKFPYFLEKIKQIEPLDQISTVQSALRQYQLFMSEFYVLDQFILTFRKQLKDIYYIRTDTGLLTFPNVLYKRHLVFNLFSIDSENR